MIPTTGPKALLHHHPHGMVDADQRLRHEIGRAWGVGGKTRAIDERARAFGQGLDRVLPHGLRETRRRHRAERGFFLERIAQFVARGEIGESVDKTVVEVFVNINSLDAAATLARVEESAVDKVLDRKFKWRIRADIGRVFAAELQADRRKSAGGGALDSPPAGDRAGEIDMVDAARAEQTAPSIHDP